MTSTDFRAALLDAGILVASSVDGVYYRSGRFEHIVRGIEHVVSTAGADQQAPLYYFPAIMPREVFELTGYLHSFPDLIGSISTFVGDDRDHAAMVRTADAGGDWTQSLTPAEVILCSAACHPLYPSLRGRLPTGGRRIECQGSVFRHEPSLDPARMQTFRQHEFVYIGDPAGAVAHRDLWLARGLALLSGLGLEVDSVVANDPFFGRAGVMLGRNQRQTTLKYEIVASIATSEPTAIASANCHQDHFTASFGIETADGDTAASACIGFGLERITLALLARHGLDPTRWPEAVRRQLWPEAGVQIRDTVDLQP